MKTFHKLCRVIALLTTVNFLLFIFITFIIGGDAVNGRIENGHYYLANHGQFTEVNYFVFMYSKIHTYSNFVLFPLAFIATILYRITGGEIHRPKSQAALSPSTKTFFSIIISFFWKIVDIIAGVFWILLDSWRKPDHEFFVRFSKEECIRELQIGTDNEPTLYNLKMPLWGHFSGTHFSIQKWKYVPFLKDGGFRPILSGKFSSTPQGTYVRLWHRFPTCGILFLTIWFGTALSLLSLYIIATNIYSSYTQIYIDARLTTMAKIIAPIFYISTLFLSIQAGSFFGRAYNLDIVEFIKDVLDHHHSSSQLAGFRLLRKLQGKG